MRFGRTPNNMPPYKTSEPMPIKMEVNLRSNTPRASRYPRKPNTTPLAPTVTDPLGETSQTPIPLPIAVRAKTDTNRDERCSAITPPKITNGTVFAIRCPNETWRNGAKAIPSIPLTRRGRMPKRVSRIDGSASRIPRTHITPSATRSGTIDRTSRPTFGLGNSGLTGPVWSN